MSRQGEDGSWEDPVCPGALSGTCFALLFLARPLAQPGGQPRPQEDGAEYEEGEGEF